jgi:uncharacterized protein (TIGR00251 family)
MGRVKKFSDGQRGIALPVRVIPRASRNEIVEILSDQTVKIRLKAPPVEGKANEELIKFLSKVLDIPKTNFEIVGGKTGRDKLISILDADGQEVNRKILENLS